MERLHKILEGVLIEAGTLKPIEMGPSLTRISVTPEVKERLIEHLLVGLKFHNRFLKALIALHFLIFVVALWLVYYNRNSLGAVSAILSISVLLLLGVIRSLSNLWQTKVGIDILIAILPGLPPEQAVKAVKDLYYNQSKPSPSSSAITERFKL